MNKILLSAFAAAAAIWASSARGDVFVPAQSGNLAVGGVENDAKDRISDLTENAARRHDGKAKTADATGDAGRKAKDGIAQDAAASVSGSGLTWLHDRRRNPGDVAGKRDTLAGPVAKVVLKDGASSNGMDPDRKKDLEGRILKEIGEGDKTFGDILDAVANAVKSFEKEKNCKIKYKGMGSFSGPDSGRPVRTYDKTTGTLTLWVLEDKALGAVKGVEVDVPAWFDAIHGKAMLSGQDAAPSSVKEIVEGSVWGRLLELGATNNVTRIDIRKALDDVLKLLNEKCGREVLRLDWDGTLGVADRKLYVNAKPVFNAAVLPAEGTNEVDVVVWCLPDEATESFVADCLPARPGEQASSVPMLIREEYRAAMAATNANAAAAAYKAIANAISRLYQNGYYAATLSRAKTDGSCLSVFFDEGKFARVRDSEDALQMARDGAKAAAGGDTNRTDFADGLVLKFGERNSIWKQFGILYEISGEDRIDGRFFGRAQIEEELGRVKEGDSFDYAKLRRALANLNANPDLQIDVSLSATNLLNTVAGGSKHVAMEITARESLPLHGMIEVNNFGMEDVEEWQVAMSLQYMNLWDKKHVLTLSGSTSVGAELMSIAGSYMAPHKWWRGGNTTLYGGLSRLDVNGIVPRLDLEGSGWFAGLQHSEYLTDQDDDHLWAVSAGILWRYMEDRYTAYGSIRLNERDISIMPLSLALSYTGRRDFSGWWENNLGGRNFMTLQGVYNVASAGDDMADMWTDADEHYWILRAQLSRLQPLPWTWMPFTKESGAYGYESQWMLFLKLEGQYTSNVLIPVEKLSLGGYNAMRGYRTRGYIGDYGVYGTAELRTPILINGIWSWFGDDDRKFVFDRFQALCFLDYGWTSFNDLPAGYDSSEFLFSAGVGFRAALSQYFQMRLDLAFPLKNAYGDDDNMELYFSVQAQF